MQETAEVQCDISMGIVASGVVDGFSDVLELDSWIGIEVPG